MGPWNLYDSVLTVMISQMSGLLRAWKLDVVPFAASGNNIPIEFARGVECDGEISIHISIYISKDFDACISIGENA